MNYLQKMPVLDRMSSIPFNDKKGCPIGFHKRSSYTSKLGHRVPPRCVKATTVYRETRKNYAKRVRGRQTERLHALGKTATRKEKCSPGKIERRGYVRKFGASVIKRGYTVKRATGKHYRVYPANPSVYVKPGCVKDRGLPGKPAPGIGFDLMRKGELKKHGYAYMKPDHERHAALNKAIKEFGALGVYHKLDAITKLSKRTAPEASRVFKTDREWLRRHHTLKAF